MQPHCYAGSLTAGPGIWVGALALVSVLVILLLTPSPATTGPDQPNIVIFVVDALRPDHLGCYGYDRPTSPNIDELARVGIRFETAITQAPWTKGSFSSILTSLYPFQHGVNDWNSVMPETLVTLPEVLSLQGYSTMCVINMIGLAERFRVLKGFDVVSEGGLNERNAKVTTDVAIDLLSEAAKPFFLIVHYFDVHEPRRPPISHLDMVRSDSDTDPLAGLTGRRRSESGPPTQDFIERELLMYDGCVRYVDDSIGRLVSSLEDQGRRQETIFIVTADHGEAFWEHLVDSHGANVYDEAIKVPLVLSYPDRYPGPEVVGEQVSHIDLFPTIVDLAGLSHDGHIEGQSLVSLIEDGVRSRRDGRFVPVSATLCECTVRRSPGTKCIRTDRWKLIVEPATSLVELYNLHDDPGETINLWGQGTSQGESMLRKIREIPGVSLRGWRIAFTGKGGQAKFTVDIDLPEGGRLSAVERFTRRQTMSIGMDEDSTSLHVEAAPSGLDFILFDVLREDSAVRFKVSAENGPVLDTVNIGAAGTTPTTDTFMITNTDALGLPEFFRESRQSGIPGVHIWWLSGDETAKPRKTISLTPDEKKRLKALGYIQ